MKPILFTTLFIIAASSAWADTAQEHQYLIQLVNQLNTMQPTILAAQKAQLKNQRIQFHYTRYQDAKGHWHNGLLEDVQAIKAGVEQKLNHAAVESRVVMPLQGDYVE